MANINLLDDYETPSFNQPISLDESKPEPKPTKRRFILKSKFIDDKTTKRTRIELTPSVCDVCALDIAEFNGLGNWYKVPEERKSDIRRAVLEHKKIVHPIKEDLIVDEDELATSWLGRDNTTL